MASKKLKFDQFKLNKFFDSEGKRKDEVWAKFDFSKINGKQNFTTILEESSTPIPLDERKVYGQSFIESNLMEFARFIPNAGKATFKLGSHTFEGPILKVYADLFSAQGTGTLEDKDVTLCPARFDLEFRQSTLEQSFMSSWMRAGSNNEDFTPEAFLQYLNEQVIAQLAEDIAYTAFRGQLNGSQSYSACTGWERTLSADTGVNRVSADTASSHSAITKDNVISAMTLAYNAIPDEVIAKDDLVMLVPTQIAKAYRLKLAETSVEASYNLKDFTLSFLDIPILEQQAQSNNTIIVVRKEALVVLTDLVSDLEEMLFIPRLGVSGDHVVRVTGSLQIAFSYPTAVDGEITFWGFNNLG